MKRNAPLLNSRFARGFDRGEREAWIDRKCPYRRRAPDCIDGEEFRGWQAGYTPRNPAWALRAVPVRCFAEVA